MKNSIFLLLLALTLILAACGGQDTAAEPTEVPPAPQTEAAETEATEAPPTVAPPTEAPAEAATTEPAAEAPAGAMVAQMVHVADEQLVNKSWQWVRRDGNGGAGADIVIENPQNYTLLFNEDGTFNTTLDCNSGSGIYATPSAGTILMELGVTTRAACPDSSHADEMTAIFGGAVQSYRIEEDGQTLVMVWAEGGALDYYRNADAEAPGADAIKAIPEDAIQLDLNGLATSYDWAVMPGNPLPAGPGGQGFPPHILITFDGTTPADAVSDQLARIYIFPVEAYVGMYSAAGNQIVADQVVRLGQLIATGDGRTQLPESPMPLLPPPNNYMDRWAQFLDLQFGAGDGVRYVSDSPFRQSIGVWANDTTGYYYQGLSTDQTFYVSMYWPVSTAALPDTAAGATAEETAAAQNPDTYPTYKQEVITALNALTPAEFSPDLTLLDGMAASLTFPLPGAGETEEETPAEEGEGAAAEGEDAPAEGAEGEGVDLPDPQTDEPTAVVTAPDGIFVRSGPGTEYADIAVAATGETGTITGVSEDGQWWVIEVPVSVAADGQGWISAAWVDASNTAGVPVVAAPEVEVVEPSLTGVNWQWLSTTTPLETITVNDPARYTIQFNEEGSAGIKADCNNVGAGYTTEGSAISITLGPSTLAACGEESLDQLFLGSLTNAAIFFFDEGDLFMDLAADGGTMRFTAGDAAAPQPPQTPVEPETPAQPETPTSPAAGVPFFLVSFGPEGAEQTPLEGTQITATFTNEAVSGSSGCNEYTGPVTPVDDHFNVGPLAVTAQECVEPAGIMEQEQAYLAALQGTAGYQWQQDAASGSVITGARLLYFLADGTSGFLNFLSQ